MELIENKMASSDTGLGLMQQNKCNIKAVRMPCSRAVISKIGLRLTIEHGGKTA